MVPRAQRNIKRGGSSAAVSGAEEPPEGSSSASAAQARSSAVAQMAMLARLSALGGRARVAGGNDGDGTSLDVAEASSVPRGRRRSCWRGADARPIGEWKEADEVDDRGKPLQEVTVEVHSLHRRRLHCTGSDTIASRTRAESSDPLVSPRHAHTRMARRGRNRRER